MPHLEAGNTFLNNCLINALWYAQQQEFHSLNLPKLTLNVGMAGDVCKWTRKSRKSRLCLFSAVLFLASQWNRSCFFSLPKDQRLLIWDLTFLINLRSITDCHFWSEVRFLLAWIAEIISGDVTLRYWVRVVDTTHSCEDVDKCSLPTKKKILCTKTLLM